MLRAAVIVVIGLPACALAFLALASYFFLRWFDFVDGYPDLWLFAWWRYVWESDRSDLKRIALPLVLSGGPAALCSVVTLMAVIGFARPKSLRLRNPYWRPTLDRRAPPPVLTSNRELQAPRVGKSANLGTAEFASDAELLERYPRPPHGQPCFPLGELYDPTLLPGSFKTDDRRTWGPGGKAQLLFHDGRRKSGHGVMFRGSGTGKTEQLKLGLRKYWTSGAIVLDPKGNLGHEMRRARQNMGHRVIIMSPEGAKHCGTNVLSWIVPGSPLADPQIDQVVEDVCGPTPLDNSGEKFFSDTAKTIIRAFLSHMISDRDCPPEARTLRTMRSMVASPEPVFLEYLTAIASSSPSRRAREFASLALRDIEEPRSDANDEGKLPPKSPSPDRTLHNVHLTAHQLTAWLSTECWADLVCGDAFQAADILDNQTDIFISIPFQMLAAQPEPARCILTALFNAHFQNLGAARYPNLFALDEVATLRDFAPIRTAWTQGREFNLLMLLLFQDRGQVASLLGPGGLITLEEGASWISYSNIQHTQTAEELSRAMGSYPGLSVSESINTGSQGRVMETRSRSRGSTVTISEIPIPLKRTDEIIGLRENAQIIMGGRKPALCGLALDFMRQAYGD